MYDFVVWSAPEEPYESHMKLCLEVWDKLSIRLIPTLVRLFELESDDKEEKIDKIVKTTILCHDIGKLSYKWQEYIHKSKEKRTYGPPHATLGASYLLSLNKNSEETDLYNASALAILMHHTDSGIAQGNLEHPAEDAINRGIVKYGTENIHWTDGAEEVVKRTFEFVNNMTILPLIQINLFSLEKMAKDLRRWARCPKEIQRHKRRLQSLAIHHVLKVCDWRAADQRIQKDVNIDEEGETVDDTWHQSILKVYLDGGLLV